MSIDEHYGFISSVGFQQKLIVKFLLLKEWKTKRCCEVSRFILNKFRTKSPKYDTNQFLPLNSLWSWICIRCFLTNTTAISTAMDTMVATTVTKLFRRRLVRQYMAATTCLPLVSDGCSSGLSRLQWTWSTTIVCFSFEATSFPLPWMSDLLSFYRKF